MDDLANLRDRLALQLKASRQDLKRAAPTVVTELAGVHVEWDVRAAWALDKSERRVRIDKAPNEPRRRHAVNAGTMSGDPTSIVEIRGTQGGQCTGRLRTAPIDSLFQHRKGRGSLSPCRRIEEVDAFDR